MAEDPPLEMCENGQDPHVHKPHCCAHEALADVLSEITIHPVKLPGNDFYSVIAEDMAAPLVEALAAAGLLRDQPAETWTEYGIFWDDGDHDDGMTDLADARAVLELNTPEFSGHIEQRERSRTDFAGPWRPVEDPNAKSETEEQQ